MEADLRTANAMVQYLLEVDSPPQTNLIDQTVTQRNLAMPTNTARVKPDA
jgi:hypothetical protein